ncbi:T9SS type A sorting domain-containing protein [Phaeodactylibacter sp.]|uniref:T9SS type A sorting domain-containing protein n=1 Tax=Phaeodactylibacter sp. TaxID=1940289 RepID=UPI0025FC9ED6|nr:T9SS type A sorting domain-containing protein [Phaeodactylibacter sp.]MCI5092082.1 T9SS type A sorting domain-containing protein [Phaeodactylibacter sp.]
MKKSIVFLGLLSLSGLLEAQEGYWTNYINPTWFGEIVEYETQLFIPSDGGLIEVNLETGAHRRWSEVDGLSSSYISSAAIHPQTGDIYAAGRYGGLDVRRAGTSMWENIPLPNSPSNDLDIYALTMDASGGLWVGTQWGMQYLKNGVWDPDHSACHYSGKVYDVEITDSGEVYLMGKGLYKIADGECDYLGGPRDSTGVMVFEHNQKSIFIDDDGTLWCAIPDRGKIVTYKDGEWGPVMAYNTEPLGSMVSFFEMPEGEIEFVAHGEAWYEWSEESWKPKPEPVFTNQPETGIILSSGERVALANPYLIWESGDSLRCLKYLFRNYVEGFINSKDGHLWMYDLEKLYNPVTAEIIPYPEGVYLRGSMGRGTAKFTDDGSLWVLHDKVIYRYQQQEWTRFDSTNSILPGASQQWGHLHTLPQGRIGVFQGQEKGAYIFDGLDWQHHPDRILPDYKYNGLAETPFGLWFLVDAGSGANVSAIWEPGNLSLNMSPLQANTGIFRLVYDPYRERLWGVASRSLHYFDGENWQEYDLSLINGGQYVRIFDIAFGSEFIALGTNDGLFIRYKDNWEQYNYANSPMHNHNPENIGIDPSGGIWITYWYDWAYRPASVDHFQRLDLPVTEAETITNPDQLTVVGNPLQNGQLVLRGPQAFSRDVSLQVFDATGRLVPVQPASIVGGFLRARVQGLAAGWYVAVVEDGGQRFTAPFVVPQ